MARLGFTEVAAVWRQRLDRFERSGLTVASFCAREGVSTASFYRWRRQAAAKGEASEPPAFRAVQVRPAALPLVVELPSGARLEVPSQDLDLVRAVVGQLASGGEPAC